MAATESPTIRKYVGRDEGEVLARIRRELGRDAVILETHFSVRRGLLGLSRRRHVEVWAGRGFGVVRDYASSPRTPLGDRVATAYREATSEPEAPARAPAAPREPSPGATERIERQLADLRELIVRHHDRQKHPEAADLGQELFEEYLALTSRQVSDRLARELVERIRKELPGGDIHNRERIREAIRASVKNLVRCADGINFVPGRCAKVAFLGPTGVGKTTTIAKLMSIYAYRGRNVGVVTCDTHRIAAADQIKRVAELVGVPVRICRFPTEVKGALDEFADRDLVLLDTAGRSQRNAPRMKELEVLLETAQPDEKHLVVSLQAAQETLSEVVDRFSGVGFDKIVITKLDEAVQTGIILDILSRVGKALSFITTGQEIPRDIEVADPQRLASIILGEEPV